MNAGLKAYLMTRGTSRRLDYNFLGTPPPDLWWRPLGDNGLILLEQPEVIAYGDGRELSILISGVPSERRDVIGTRIRYTLVVDHIQQDLDLARRLAVTGLSAEGRARLGHRLDEDFDAAMVDGLLNGSDDGSAVEGFLVTMLASSDWSMQADDADREIQGSWAGPADDADARAAFLVRIGTLAAGNHGFAFTTHSLTTREGAERAAADLPGTSAMLLADGELEAVVNFAGKVPSEAPRRVSRRLLLVAAAVAVAAAGAITVLAFLL